MQVQEDATPWEIPPPRGPEEAKVELESPCLLDGRAHFSRLGVVRRKPARMDAEPTWSKSCSDKLALRQVSSLLSYETSLVVAPTENAYLAGLILPEREVSRRGCERAFGVSGRMAELNGRFWPDGGGDEEVYGYRFRPFRVLSIPDKMARDLRAFGKPDPVRDLDDSGKKCKPSNVSAIWARAASGTDSERVGNGIKTLPSLRGTQTGLYETIVNGVRQGSRASSPVLRGASVLSRAKLWGLLREVYMDSGIASVEEDDEVRRRVLEATTYNEFKKVLLEKDSIGARSDAIQDARKALKGWIRNSGDEGWGLEVSVDAKKRKVDNFLV